MIALLSILGTIIIFYSSKKLYAVKKTLWLSPLLVCPLIIILLLVLFHIPYNAYNEGASWLSKLLGPATVAFAIPMYKHYDLLKKNLKSILYSLGIGCLVAILSVYMIASFIGLDEETVNSLVPKSITTPIAMDISTILGGDPTMTAVFVIVTGLSGSVIGPLIIRAFRLKQAASKGLLLGMGAHGCGTSKAFEFGEKEGTFSSLAMIIAALVSIVLSEVFHGLF